MTEPNPTPDRLTAALEADDASIRLRAAMAAGSEPDIALLPVLIERSGVEPDFFVRDMLTWAITRLPRESTVPALLAELDAAAPQRRSQSLHTLSKLGEVSAWPQFPVELVADPDDEVAKAAWRAAVSMAPDDARTDLAARLATQFGRGDLLTQRSLSRALIALGDDADDAITVGTKAIRPEVRVHALATQKLVGDPEAEFAGAIDDARRIVALGN